MVIGDESREKLSFLHKNLNIKGFLKHNSVLDVFKKTSISVVCSRWEEPFGRTSLEAASCGCAVIITRRGGLPETITNGIIVDELNVQTIYDAIESLIKKKLFRTQLQKMSLKNFYLTNEKASQEIDLYRDDILINNPTETINKKFK